MNVTRAFADPVHDSQESYRTLLAALAEPFLPVTLPIMLQAPASLEPACAAACLTLLDGETSVWLQPGCGFEIREWLRFHTGCGLAANPSEADFALICDPLNAPPLSTFRGGTITHPQTSATLFIQLASFEAGARIRVRGPGIPAERSLGPDPIADTFWEQWVENAAGYPLGVDVFLFAGDRIVGLPRTTRLVEEAQ